MINNVDVREALRVHLVGLTPALATDWDNWEYTPVIGTPFQTVHFKPNTPNDLSIEIDDEQEGLGFLQVLLKYPKGESYLNADTRADLTVNRFKRGTRLTNSGMEVRIKETPTTNVLGIIEDRYTVAVTIYYFAYKIV